MVLSVKWDDGEAPAEDIGYYWETPDIDTMFNDEKYFINRGLDTLTIPGAKVA